MGPIALACAVAAALVLMLPAPGLFVAMGMGIFAAAAGLVAYRRRQARGSHRIAGAAAIAMAAIVCSLSLLEYGLTLAAVSKLAAMFG